MVGKVLLTGSTGGFGSALKVEFEKAGYAVVGIDRTPHLDEEAVACDLSIPASVDQACASIENLHQDATVLVLNAAGLGVISSAIRVPERDLEALFRINFFSQKKIIDCALDASNIETVVHVSSGASERIYPEWSPYGLTKGVLNRLLGYYREELPGVNFLNVNPGAMDTDMNRRLRARGSTAPWISKFREPKNLANPAKRAKALIKVVQAANIFNTSELVDLSGLPLEEGSN